MFKLQEDSIVIERELACDGYPICVIGSGGDLPLFCNDGTSYIVVYEAISQCKIMICQGDVERLREYIKEVLPSIQHYILLDLNKNSKAATFFHEDERIIILWLPMVENVGIIGVLAHEALHVAYRVIQSMDVLPHTANEELTAYLIQFIVNNYTQCIGLNK